MNRLFQKRAVDRIKHPFSIVLFLGGFLILGMALINHYMLRSYAFDFAAYNFAFYDYAHFRVSPCPVYLFPYNVTFLQDHFSITLMLLSPFYWLMAGITGTYTLLILQTCIVIYGGWATYKLILLKSDNKKLALLSLVYYFVLLGRLTAGVADCNLAIIGSALVPAFLYYFEKNKILPALIIFLLMVFNREDFSLWLIFIYLFLMLLHRKDAFKLKFSVLLSILSLIFFIIIFKWIIPSLEDENKKYDLFTFSALGKTPAEALSFILQNPLKTIELLFINQSGSNYYDGIKKEFYIVYLVSGGALLLYRPLFIIPFIPLLAKKMYNDMPIRWSMESYYAVEIVSLLPIAVFLIIAGVRNNNLKLILGLLVCICTVVMSISKITKPADQHIAMLGDKQKIDFLSSDFYHSDYNLNEIYEAMKLIPDTAVVSASGKVCSHLALREKIYYFPRVDNANYVFLLKKNDNWPISKGQSDTIVADLLSNKNWKVLSQKKDFVLLHKE